MSTKTRKPTQKQSLFADYYLAGNAQWKAAELAGYAGDQATLYTRGHELLRSSAVKAVIEERQLAARISEGIDLSIIVAGLHSNALNAAIDGQYSASNQAWGLIGKALGLITDKHEVTTTSIRLDMTKALEGKSVEELLRLAAKAPKAIEGRVIDAEEQGQP